MAGGGCLWSSESAAGSPHGGDAGRTGPPPRRRQQQVEAGWGHPLGVGAPFIGRGCWAARRCRWPWIWARRASSMCRTVSSSVWSETGGRCLRDLGAWAATCRSWADGRQSERRRGVAGAGGGTSRGRGRGGWGGAGSWALDGLWSVGWSGQGVPGTGEGLGAEGRWRGRGRGQWAWMSVGTLGCGGTGGRRAAGGQREGGLPGGRFPRSPGSRGPGRPASAAPCAPRAAPRRW